MTKEEQIKRSAEIYLDVFNIYFALNPKEYPVDKVLIDIYKHYEIRVKELGHLFAPYPISKSATDEQIKTSQYYEAIHFTQYFYDFFVNSKIDKVGVEYSKSYVCVIKPFDKSFHREKFFIPKIFEDEWAVLDFFKAEIDKKYNEVLAKNNNKGK